jgi:hypothetical protein
MLPAVRRKENRRRNIETILRRGGAVQGEYHLESTSVLLLRRVSLYGVIRPDEDGGVVLCCVAPAEKKKKKSHLSPTIVVHCEAPVVDGVDPTVPFREFHAEKLELIVISTPFSPFANPLEHCQVSRRSRKVGHQV